MLPLSSGQINAFLRIGPRRAHSEGLSDGDLVCCVSEAIQYYLADYLS